MNITQEMIDKRIRDLFAEDPMKMLLTMMIASGKLAVEANAASLDMKTEANVEEDRYEIKLKVSVKKVKKPSGRIN